LVACLAVVVSSLGVPLPVPMLRHANELYPCAQCGCGCTDAETCWRKCCCYTNEQKLAWAERHGVTPPGFVIAAAARERASASKHQACCESAVCHSTDCRRPCCAHRESASCCQAASAPRETKSSRSFVLGISALRCRGLSLTVSSMPPSLPLEAVLQRFRADDLVERVCVRERHYQSPTLPVASPPPDAVAA
jgi:hypothetical protein